MTVRLSDKDRALLAGDHGPAARFAMSILVRMAEVEGAEEMLDVVGAHIDSTLYQGDATLEFAERLADMGAQVVWRDTEARSLSSTVDALGKLAQMLGVPPQELWDQIPGVSAQDVERWRATAAEGDSLGQFAAMLDRQTQALLPETPMG